MNVKMDIFRYTNLKVVMRDIVGNIESFGDWSGSLLMEIYVIYDNATECPKQKLLLGLYGELFCVDREGKN